MNECQADGDQLLGFRQSLHVQRGVCDPVTVTELLGGPRGDPLQLCQLEGMLRAVTGPLISAPIQRLEVSPNGSTVVFEVTDDHLVYPLTEAAPGQEGIWLVRADGTGLRRLGPASRDPPVRCLNESCIPFNFDPRIAFSPNGKKIAFTDRGPDADGRDAVELFVQDLASGARTQVTRVPHNSPPPGVGEIALFRFLSNDTLGFSAGQNDGTYRGYTVRTDGTHLEPLPMPVAIEGSRPVPVFEVTGRGLTAFNVNFLRTSAEPVPALVQEVFAFNARRLVQLTAFERTDTQARLVEVDGKHVVFIASADPLGRNPTNNCQLFAIDWLGGGLRQLTSFGEGSPTHNGCYAAGAPPGCYVAGSRADQDPSTHSLVFDSSCDPLGTNPYGVQLFAMRPDGSGLRQLTDTRGFETHLDGSVSVEFAGHYGYSGRNVAR